MMDPCSWPACRCASPRVCDGMDAPTAAAQVPHVATHGGADPGLATPDAAAPEPVGWLESPHGAFRANPAHRIEAPQSLAWSLPVYLAAQPATDAAAMVDEPMPITDDEQAALYRFVEGTPHYSVVRKLYRLASASAQEAPAQVPQGWVLVPVEPTREMLAAVDDEDDDKHVARGRAYSAWTSMLAARPQPEAPAQGLEALQTVALRYPSFSPQADWHYRDPDDPARNWRGEPVAGEELVLRSDAVAMLAARPRPEASEEDERRAFEAATPERERSHALWLGWLARSRLPATAQGPSSLGAPASPAGLSAPARSASAERDSA